MASTPGPKREGAPAQPKWWERSAVTVRRAVSSCPSSGRRNYYAGKGGQAVAKRVGYASCRGAPGVVSWMRAA